MATYDLGAPSQGSAWVFFYDPPQRTFVEKAPDHIIIHRDFPDGRYDEQRFYGVFTFSEQFDGLGRPVAYGRLDTHEFIINGDLWYRYGDLGIDMQLALHAPFDDYDWYQAMVFGGADAMTGDRLADTLNGYDGDDTITSGAGNDTVDGGAGADVLRGGDGDDSLYGGVGAAHDDINGNAGADTASGGAGDDWVVGGKDNDVLSGDDGDDIVLGNRGDDTCEGGAGADIVRGGQGADVIAGGAGDDFVSGDRGDDTITGGAGADAFHTFGDAGIDRVLDFNLAEGDRVQLDPGTQYSVAQVGADTVISMAGGGQMILVGVSMASLTPGWILGG